MTVTVRQRKNGNHQAEVEVPGLTPVFGTFPDEAAARAWGVATEATLMSGGFPPLKAKARALVKVVLAEYEISELPAQASEKSSRSRIKTLTRLLGDLTLANLNVEVLEEFKRIRMGSVHGPRRGKNAEAPRETRYRLKGRAKRLVDAGAKEKRTVSSQSCRHEVMLLQRAVRWWSYKFGLALEKRGHPVFEIKLPAKSVARDRRFEAGEAERLEAVIDDSKTLLGRAIRFLRECGMRRSELCDVRWENLTLTDGYAVMWLEHSKHPDRDRQDGRWVSLSPVAVQILRDLGIKSEGRIWEIEPDSLTQAFGRARERAGITGLRLADTRRDAASNKAEAGWSLPMVATLTGHKDYRTLQRVYLRLRAVHLSKLMHTGNSADGTRTPGSWD